MSSQIKICGLCLSKTQNYIYIFDPEYVAADMIAELLQFDVSGSNRYPPFICHECYNILSDFKNFKEKCQNSRKEYGEECLQEEDNFQGNCTTVSESTYERQFAPLNEMCANRKDRDENTALNSSENISEEPIDIEFHPVKVKVEVEEFHLNEDNLEDPSASLWLTADMKNPAFSQGEPVKKLTAEYNNEEQSTFSDSKNSHLEISLNNTELGRSSKDTSVQQTVPFCEQSSLIPYPACGRSSNLSANEVQHDVSAQMHSTYRIKIEKPSNSPNEMMELHRETVVDGIHSHIGWYTCDICKKEFDTKESLNEHQSSHENKKEWECSICWKKTFSTYREFEGHKRSHQKSKSFICDICVKPFNVKSSGIQKPVVMQNSLKPYQCLECNKQFISKSTLNMHLLLHAGGMPYTCDLCGKRFAEKGILVAHMKVHRGDKPFACKDCDMRIRSRGDANCHMEKRVTDRSYACDECAIRFKCKKDLIVHRQGFHFYGK